MQNRLKIIIPALFVLTLTACQGMTQQDVGTLTGGAVGALLGNQIGGGTGRTIATIGGAVFGAYLGSKIGESMDKTDKLEMEQALEKTRTQNSYSWHNPDTNVTYKVQPTETYYQEEGGQSHPCRTFVTTALIDGKAEKVTGKACRRSNGSWKMIS